MSERNLDTSLNRDKSALVAELVSAKAEVSGNTVKCPFHDDKNPSGEIKHSTEGVWRYMCHAESCDWSFGDVFDVRDRINGLQPGSSLMKVNEGEKKVPIPTKPKSSPVPLDQLLYDGSAGIKYKYANPTTGKIDLVIFRLKTPTGKKFLQARPEGNGFVWGAPPEPLPLYNRSRIADAKRVVVVEGEKCVHALDEVGVTATTSPCGAGKALYADWIPLAGKDVILWPDNAEAGLSHMRDVAVILDGLNPATTVSVINPASLELKSKGDCVNFLESVKPVSLRRKAVEDVLADAGVVGASKGVLTLLQDTISGKRRAIPWPWKSFSNLTRALLPGAVTFLCGDGGVAKSFFILEAAAFWHNAGEKIALYEMEEDREFHLLRALAQRVQSNKILDPEWVVEHPKWALEEWESEKPFLDSFGRTITQIPTKGITRDGLTKWVAERAKAGCRIIIIDPITATTSPKPWEDDLKFLMDTKEIIRKYGASLILVTHPRKGRKNSITLDDMAGGAACSRFTAVMLWLDAHKGIKTAVMFGREENRNARINRSVHLIKTRNARGSGLILGFMFDPDTMCFTEEGIILKKRQGYDDVEEEVESNVPF